MESSRIKISVLVPIFNVEKYLAHCLDSLLHQTLKEIEIICINDGSTDASLDIIKSYAKKDKRVVLLNKENTGYGDSMNRGLSLARGKYIAVLESDDFAELNLLEILYSTAEKYSLDVAKGNYNLYWSDKRCQKNKWKKEIIDANIIGKVINPRNYTEICLIPPSIWSGIYKRNFLLHNEISFLASPGASYQDTGFAFKVWSTANRVMLIDYAGINYRQDNMSSSMNTVSKYKVFCLDDEYISVIDYLKRKNVFDIFYRALYRYILGTIAWNIGRMPKTYLTEYMERERSIFRDAFFNKSNILMYDKASLGNKLVWYAIRNKSMFLLDIYRFLARLTRK